MSIQTQAQVEDLQRKVKELSSMQATDFEKVGKMFAEFAELAQRVADLEAKYKMLNARVGWNKEKAA